MKLFCAYEPDIYELPVCVAGSAQELARFCGYKKAGVYSQLNKHRKPSNRGRRPRGGTRYVFRVVEVDDV